MISKGYNPWWGKTMGDISSYIARGGKLIARQKHSKVSKNSTRTRELMALRIVMTNLVLMWRNLLPVLHYTFYNKKNDESDYNAFVAMNKRKANVYLTRQQVDDGACVLMPMCVSKGSLPDPVQLTLKEGMWVSDLFLGDLQIGDATTVGQFSAALIQRNRCYKKGSLLRFLRVYQRTGENPSIEYYSFSVVLDPADTRLLRQVAGTDGFLSTQSTITLSEYESRNGYFLSAKDLANSMLCYIHSEYVDGNKLDSTTQWLHGTNSLLEGYSSDEALDKAIESYGGTRRRNSMDPHTDEETWEEKYGDGRAPEGSGSQTEAKVQLTFAVNNSSLGQVSPASGEFTVGSTVQATASVKSGASAEFTGWSDGVTTATRTITVPAEPATYTANFRTTGGGNQGGGIEMLDA